MKTKINSHINIEENQRKKKRKHIKQICDVDSNEWKSE